MASGPDRDPLPGGLPPGGLLLEGHVPGENRSSRLRAVGHEHSVEFLGTALQVAQPKSPGAGSGSGNTAAVIDDPELATSVFHRESYRGLIGLSVAADIGDRFANYREQRFPDGVGDGGVDLTLKRCPDLESDHRPQFLQ